METQQDISRSIHVTIEEIKTNYLESEFINDLKALDKHTKKRKKLEGRELADWNIVIYNKCRRKFDSIVRAACKRNGRNEDHIQRITGWKRGRNITNLSLTDKE